MVAEPVIPHTGFFFFHLLIVLCDSNITTSLYKYTL